MGAGRCSELAGVTYVGIQEGCMEEMALELAFSVWVNEACAESGERYIHVVGDMNKGS